MKVSIAMATFNGAAYLDDQLASFLCQTRLPDELVISDDASSDNTREIIDAFKESAPFPVVLISNPDRRGYSANFNNALLHASGDLIFLSDQDDVWLNNKIEVMTEIARKNPSAQAVMCDAELADRSLECVGLTKIGQIRAAGLSDSSYVMGNTVAVRRRFLELVLPIPNDYPSHDSWIVRMAEGVGGKLIHSEVLQLYRRHESNVSHFLPNQLTPIGRWDVLKKKWRTMRAVFNGAYIAKQRQALKEGELFLDGIVRARSRCSKEEGKWEDFRREKQKLITLLRQRLSYMEHSKPGRCPEIFRAWKRGDYGQYQGVITATCDLLANKDAKMGEIDKASDT